ncbi:hypothetical protein C791_2830 [Amycolatopsis azurea DSM 43854]|uniref:Uncharacterized protein n=1 Tax=Amycolatopsis azurea DSM 43854 TaxID=1238180 RepID=M2Q4F5_9PSEU|nr:hypothetical protein C791_2830 [Amycolatopsis azurea DSM 43854]
MKATFATLKVAKVAFTTRSAGSRPRRDDRSRGRARSRQPEVAGRRWVAVVVSGKCRSNGTYHSRLFPCQERVSVTP